MLFYYPYCIFQLLSLRSCFFLIAANHDKHHMHPDRLLRSFKTPSPFLCRTKTPMGQYSTPNQKKICQPPLHWEHHWVDDTSASVIAPLLVIGMTADSCVELDKPYLLYVCISGWNIEVRSYWSYKIPGSIIYKYGAVIRFHCIQMFWTFLPKTINHQSSLGTQWSNIWAFWTSHFKRTDSRRDGSPLSGLSRLFHFSQSSPIRALVVVFLRNPFQLGWNVVPVVLAFTAFHQKSQWFEG